MPAPKHGLIAENSLPEPVAIDSPAARGAVARIKSLIATLEGEVRAIESTSSSDLTRALHIRECEALVSAAEHFSDPKNCQAAFIVHAIDMIAEADVGNPSPQVREIARACFGGDRRRADEFLALAKDPVQCFAMLTRSFLPDAAKSVRPELVISALELYRRKGRPRAGQRAAPKWQALLHIVRAMGVAGERDSPKWLENTWHNRVKAERLTAVLQHAANRTEVPVAEQPPDGIRNGAPLPLFWRLFLAFAPFVAPDPGRQEKRR